MDRIRSRQIREELKTQGLDDFVKKRQLGWWGHLQRMGTHTQTRAIWGTTVTGKRRRGRPKRTWEDEIDSILEERDISREEATRLAKDRRGWREFVAGDS